MEIITELAFDDIQFRSVSLPKRWRPDSPLVCTDAASLGSDGDVVLTLSMWAKGKWGRRRARSALCVPALPVSYPTNRGLNYLPVWVGATASKLIIFCPYLCQLFTQCSSSLFFFCNYLHFHHLSPSSKKFNVTTLPVKLRFSYRLLTLDWWRCKMAEVTMNPFLFFFFMHFFLSLNLFYLLTTFCLPAPLILFVLQKSFPIKFQTTQSEFS